VNAILGLWPRLSGISVSDLALTVDCYRTQVTLTSLCLGVLLATTVDASAQSADRIVKQAAKAMGGEKALKNIKSWQVKGAITKRGESGSYLATATRPNLYTSTFEIRGLEVSAGYNGKSGWMRDSRDGLRTLTGAESRDFQAEALWRNSRWLDYKKDRSKLLFAGQTTIDSGKTTNCVILTTSKNVKIKMYFEVASGLLVREELPADAASKVFGYSDFRAVNGVMEPHSIAVTIGDEHYEVKLDEVLHNPQLDRSIFDFPRTLNEPLPDIPALLKEVGENEDEVDRILEKYTYTATQTKREIDSKGQIREKESETFELTFYRGYRIRRLVARNGKPLSASDEANETKRLEKRIREIERKEKTDKGQQPGETDQNNEDDSGAENGRRISIANIFRASRLINPRRERFRGREVIVFDFEPLPGYKPRKDYEKLLGKMAGAMWIDATDKQVARIEARLVEAYKIGGGLLASLKEGAMFVIEQDRFNDEIWLPTRADINIGVKVLIFGGLNLNLNITYGDYKRFNVESEKERLKNPVEGERSSKP
jgi:hypothetical protein